MCQLKANSWKIHYGYGKCKRCGDTKLDTLTWHHRNPALKKFNISKKACRWWALDPRPMQVWQSNVWNSIRNECRKCDLLCKWCHQTIHKLPKKARHKDRMKLFWATLDNRKECMT